MKKIFCITIVMALLSPLMSINTNAQINIPCRPEVEGLHFTIPSYSYTPVLFSNMPHDIMISYIITDSIRKYVEDVNETA